MSARPLVAVCLAAAIAALALACGDDESAPDSRSPVQTQSRLALRFVFGDPTVVRWEDVGSEDGYAVTGAVTYWVECQFLDAVESPSVELPLDTELPPGTAELPLPEPDDERFTFLHTIEARVQTLGPPGLSDELAYSADPGCE